MTLFMYSAAKRKLGLEGSPLTIEGRMREKRSKKDNDPLQPSFSLGIGLTQDEEEEEDVVSQEQIEEEEDVAENDKEEEDVQNDEEEVAADVIDDEDEEADVVDHGPANVEAPANDQAAFASVEAVANDQEAAIGQAAGANVDAVANVQAAAIDEAAVAIDEAVVANLEVAGNDQAVPAIDQTVAVNVQTENEFVPVHDDESDSEHTETDEDRRADVDVSLDKLSLFDPQLPPQPEAEAHKVFFFSLSCSYSNVIKYILFFTVLTLGISNSVYLLTLLFTLFTHFFSD